MEEVLKIRLQNVTLNAKHVAKTLVISFEISFILNVLILPLG